MATDAVQAVSYRPQPAGRTRLRVFVILFVSFLVMMAVAAIATIYVTGNFWQKSLQEEMTRDLVQKAQMFATRVNTDRNAKIGDLTAQVAQQAGARATVIDSNGKVIADSQIPISQLESEGAREEFAALRRGEAGIATRSQGAFGIPVLYVAVPVSGGAVRLASSLADVEVASAAGHRALLYGCIVGVVAAFLISFVTARMLTP